MVLTSTQAGNSAIGNFRVNPAIHGRLGTDGFIALEWEGTLKIDFNKADIYSLGTTIWMLVKFECPKKKGPGS